MDFHMTEEQRMITGAVRRFVHEEVAPLERELDPDAVELPPGELDRLKEIVRGMGLYHIDVPEDHGGPGLPLTTRGLVAEEMSQHRAGLYLPCYGSFGSAGLAQLYSASEEQKERYLYPMLRGEKRSFFGLTEPSGGSDPGAGDPDAGGEGWGRLGVERVEAVQLGRGSGGFWAGVCAERSVEGAAGDLGVPGGHGYAGVRGAAGGAHAAVGELRDRALV